ncbi:MAG: hypothetical protein WCP20_06840 [Desulfuromonadales bacterium]
MVSNLLLITDMARLSKIFFRLADGGSFTLRVVNNLEKGGEEIAIQKPDVVFVQTHLSGLSADILLKHLKKQLGRKRSRFVLLAAPGQVSNDILKPFHGWLDISCEDSALPSAIQNVLTSLLSKTKIQPVPFQPAEKILAAPDPPEPVTMDETTALLKFQPFEATVPEIAAAGTLPVAPTAEPEPSLEDQGITYSPRSRLSVYSEFTSSFDNAVNKTPEPESLANDVPMLEQHIWNSGQIDTIETVEPRSKRSIFLMWLAPVVVAVIVVTFMQKNTSVSKPVAVITPPVVSPPPDTGAAQPATAKVNPSEPPKQHVATKPDHDSRMTDKAVITAIAENHGTKATVHPSDSSVRPSVLPDFVPRNGLDKQYGIANPGWERYRGQVTEFKVLREAQTIKAIQIIDRGGQGVPESFMQGVLRQFVKKPVFTPETSEKKEGYEIQRGRVSDNLKVVYYRDEQGGKLRAFVMSWQ